MFKKEEPFQCERCGEKYWIYPIKEKDGVVKLCSVCGEFMNFTNSMLEKYNQEREKHGDSWRDVKISFFIDMLYTYISLHDWTNLAFIAFLCSVLDSGKMANVKETIKEKSPAVVAALRDGAKERDAMFKKLREPREERPKFLDGPMQSDKKTMSGVFQYWPVTPVTNDDKKRVVTDADLNEMSVEHNNIIDEIKKLRAALEWGHAEFYKPENEGNRETNMEMELRVILAGIFNRAGMNDKADH